MPVNYSYRKYVDARQDLANRLYDPDKQFWSDAELGYYIKDALRTWNSLSNFFREEYPLNLQSSVVWYDITSAAVAPGTLRAFTLTDVDIYTGIEYHLLEPPLAGGLWIGSLQFSVADMLSAVQRRRDEILSNTGCTVTRKLIDAPIQRRVYLTDSEIDIRRVAWLPTGSVFSNLPLWLDDSFSLQAFSRGYTLGKGVPSVYQKSSSPQLSFDVDYEPPVPGNYELLVVDAGSELSASAPSVLNIPDDYAWVLRFGALADLLSRESNAKDTLRAQYCNLRYEQGLALLLSSSAILSVRLKDTPLDIDSVYNLDNFRPNWQAEQAGEPDVLITTGLNLVGFAKTPGSSYTVVLGVVRNAPLPSLDDDYIQAGRDEYDVIVDYAQHVAMFKVGGMEFLETLPLLHRFIRQAKIYNAKLMELGEFNDVMYAYSKDQQEDAPTYVADSTGDKSSV